MKHPRPLGLMLDVVPADGGYYRGYEVYLNSQHVGHRPYDGSDPEEVETEVVEALAGLLKERLGWGEVATDE